MAPPSLGAARNSRPPRAASANQASSSGISVSGMDQRKFAFDLLLFMRAMQRTPACSRDAEASRVWNIPIVGLTMRYSRETMRSALCLTAGKYFVGIGMLAALVLTFALRSFPQAIQPQDPWEPAIRKFEEQDKVNPPKSGCIVFAGSSSFRYWDTL